MKDLFFILLIFVSIMILSNCRNNENNSNKYQIEKNIQNNKIILNDTILDFDSITCYSIYSALKHYKTAEDLILSGENQQYFFFPDSISNLKIKVLWLENMYKLDLYDAIEKLYRNDSLVEIKIVTDSILKKVPSNLYKIKKLKNLFIIAKQISEISDSLLFCKNLEQLVIGGNFKRLPSNLGKLNKLVVIDLSESSLTVFPKELLQLRNIMTIDLHDNNISDIPKQIITLKKLKYLDMIGTPFAKKEALYHYHNKKYKDLVYFKEKMPQCSIFLGGLDNQTFDSMNNILKQSTKKR
jgi:Leucine-rich repeat (LRR) protein